LIKGYFRAEVRGFDTFPESGGALVVSNHSGGMFTPDVLVFAPAFYKKLGYSRPLYTLAHWAVLKGPTGGVLRRLGAIEANRENAGKALGSGAVVLVFPGGDYDSYRPTFGANVVDFGGRTGYARSAIAAGVPIVPVVSIGAQESQLFLSRGDSIARWLGLKRLLRTEILPVSIGFPFGLSVLLPPNLPLPTKIVTQVLEPIHIAERFGDDPDVNEVDAHVRSVMQAALDRLARERRLPVLG
jgi:1-acyl-sn-glycerol-3-phosphate acyltransferase